MSIQFNDTSTYKGLVQKFEKEIGFNRGDISGNSDKLKEFTADVNVAFDDFISIAIQAGGRWQYDDSNHTGYPIITTSLVSGQRDYSFTVDSVPSLILDIYKVAILPSSTATLYQSIEPINELEGDTDVITGSTVGGTPYGYSKLANGIFLEPRPNYSVSAGLKIFINREPSYFSYDDTTKKPGVPGIFHKYFYLKPARDYARIHSLACYERLNNEILKLEGDEERGIQGEIAKYFSRREKDVRPLLEYEEIIYQ